MDFVKFKEKFSNNLKVRKLDDNNFMIYLPFFFKEDGQNFPLLINEKDGNIILSEQGFLIDRLFDNEERYKNNKEKIIKILNDYEMELNKGCMELQCKEDEVLEKISYYLQALSIINYLFR